MRSRSTRAFFAATGLAALLSTAMVLAASGLARAQDYEALMAEPIDAARARLGIVEPAAYLKAQSELGPELASYLSNRREQTAMAAAA